MNTGKLGDEGKRAGYKVDTLTTILADATRAIALEYFLLPIDGAVPVYRERVYCYELYHQMRIRWPERTDWRLYGEIDKRAHPYFDKVDARIPDLLVHKPGTRSNHAIIEAKTSSLSLEGIKKDLSTLTTFSCCFGYKHPIYLVFGPAAERAAENIKRAIKARRETACIELWLHLSAGSPAEFVWRHDGTMPSFQGQ